jgi:anti-sigma-K factor RskA
MNADENTDECPGPEDLTAYVDGELDLIARLHVERWLACDPEATREVDAQRYLCELWRATAPSDPSPADWAEAARRSASRRFSARPRRLVSWLAPPRLNLHRAATAALAATVLLAIILGPLPSRPKPMPPVDEDFPVLNPNDVEIISVSDADSGGLIVGELPLHEPIVTADAADIRFGVMPGDEDGGVPYIRVSAPGSNAPIITPWPPRGPWKAKDKAKRKAP